MPNLTHPSTQTQNNADTLPLGRLVGTREHADSWIKIKYYIQTLLKPGWRIFSKLLSGQFKSKLRIYRITKRWPNLDHPQTYNDKLLLYMSSNFMESCSAYVDKIAVRDYVKSRVGSHVLSTIFGVYDSYDGIDFAILPEKFYLKTNHGSGWNLPCLDKKKFILNARANKKTITKWLQKNYFHCAGERQYKKIQPKLYTEEYLDAKLPKNMLLRIFTFHGKAEFIQVTGKIGEDTIVNNFYDCHWAFLPFTIGRRHNAYELKQPGKLEQMIQVAELLAKPFPFVRVDLYDLEGRIVFSELTFSPSAAGYAVSPEEWSYKVGKMFPASFENYKKVECLAPR